MSESSPLTGLAAKLVRETAQEARRPDWEADAREHFGQAATHFLAGLVELRRAELGLPAGATGGPQR